MRHSRGLVALGLAVLCSCGGGDAAVLTQFEISGHVVDARSGKAISNADVDFSSDTLDHAETSSDADGHFTLHVDVHEGVMFGTVTATHANFQAPAAQSVYFDDLPHVVTLELQPK